MQSYQDRAQKKMRKAVHNSLEYTSNNEDSSEISSDEWKDAPALKLSRKQCSFS